MTEVGELITPNGVLVITAEQMREGREGWLAARRWRESVPGGYCIGASEVPSILDLQDVDTPAHVYRAKVMNIRREANEQMMWGTRFEPIIAEEWCRSHRAVIDEIGLVAHKDFPWAQATIDRRVRECPVYKDTPDGECLLEVKHMDFAPASRWHEKIPDRLLAQMLFQLWVTGYEHGHFACKVPGTMKVGTVWANEHEQITEYMIREVDRFRTEHLIPGVEPEWTITDKALKMIELDKLTHPERVGELDINGVDAVHEYAQASADESAAKKRRERAKARLLQLSDGAEHVKFAGELAYRVGTGTRSTADLDKLAEKYPEAYRDPEIVRTTRSPAIYIAKPYKI